MAKYTITPWRTQADLLQVRQQLYRLNNSGSDARRYAVDRVMAWKLRGNLPHAVESTALLIDAFLHHDLASNSNFSIRAVYSAAFTRFVTGFCDIGRNRERALEPSSMLNIARQIDMPVEFVALRHEATHEELPSVQRLVTACEQALQWLWRVYWSRLEEPQSEATPAEGEVTRIREEVTKLFKEFRSAKRQAVKGRVLASKHAEIERKAAASCKGLCQGSRAAWRMVATVLVEDKTLIPADREMNSKLDGAFLIWDGLLQVISFEDKQFLCAILDIMLRSLSQATSSIPQFDSFREALCFWIHHIATANNWGPARTKSENDVQYRIMSWCCLHPSHWSFALGKLMLEDSDTDFRDSWEGMFLASQMQDSAMNGDGDITADSALVHDETKESRIVNSSAMELDEIAVSLPWHRTVLAPRAPIGVVH